MKKQELYNKIRIRINELVPRSKELSFGCFDEVLIDEIIGHSIHLEHILEAIGNKADVGISIIPNNIAFFGVPEIHYSNRILFNYDYTLSPENQSLETLEALDKLLNTNEK